MRAKVEKLPRPSSLAMGHGDSSTLDPPHNAKNRGAAAFPYLCPREISAVHKTAPVSREGPFHKRKQGSNIPQLVPGTDARAKKAIRDILRSFDPSRKVDLLKDLMGSLRSEEDAHGRTGTPPLPKKIRISADPSKDVCAAGVCPIEPVAASEYDDSRSLKLTFTVR